MSGLGLEVGVVCTMCFPTPTPAAIVSGTDRSR